MGPASGSSVPFLFAVVTLHISKSTVFCCMVRLPWCRRCHVAYSYFLYHTICSLQGLHTSVGSFHAQSQLCCSLECEIGFFQESFWILLFWSPHTSRSSSAWSRYMFRRWVHGASRVVIIPLHMLQWTHLLSGCSGKNGTVQWLWVV